MKLNFLFFSLIFLGFLSCTSSDIEIIQNGTTTYSLILPNEADSNEVKAADELRFI